MMDKERMEATRQEIFEIALNIARLKLHSCYMDRDGHLVGEAPDAVESRVRALRQQLEYQAANALMAGDWR